MVVTLGQQCNTGGKSTVTLYTYINRHAGTLSVVVVVFTLKTVLTSIQYILFLILQGKETKIRGHKLTQNKVQKNKIKRPGESSNTCEKI